jgi:hypothetical protein
MPAADRASHIQLGITSTRWLIVCGIAVSADASRPLRLLGPDLRCGRALCFVVAVSGEAGVVDGVGAPALLAGVPTA